MFKLHGSVNWARFVDTPTAVTLGSRKLIDHADTMKLTSEYTTSVPGEANRAGRLLFPAIAIPVQTKSDFECPPSHLARLTELLRSVTKILIMGWQAKEEHFLTLLRSNLPPLKRIMVVSGNAMEAQKVLGHFTHEIRPEAALRAKSETTSGGFTDFVVNRRGDEFFRD